jgi:hypothetical protein
VENKKRKSTRNSQHQNGPIRHVEEGNTHLRKVKIKESEANEVEHEGNCRSDVNGNKTHVGRLRSKNVENSNRSSQIQCEMNENLGSEHGNKKERYEH